MSHDSVLSALNALSKTRVYHTVPEEHVHHLIGETSRARIILNGSAIEHMLAHRLEQMMPSLNSDEHSRIFGPDGPLGTFANKTRIAKGLGIIDRTTSKQIDVIRAMRNAAAHCVTPISFADKPLKDGVLQIAPCNLRPQIKLLEAGALRDYFELTCMSINSLLISGNPHESDEDRLQTVLSGVLPS